MKCTFESWEKQTKNGIFMKSIFRHWKYNTEVVIVTAVKLNSIFFQNYTQNLCRETLNVANCLYSYITCCSSIKKSKSDTSLPNKVSGSVNPGMRSLKLLIKLYLLFVIPNSEVLSILLFGFESILVLHGLTDIEMLYCLSFIEKYEFFSNLNFRFFDDNYYNLKSRLPRYNLPRTIIKYLTAVVLKKNFRGKYILPLLLQCTRLWFSSSNKIVVNLLLLISILSTPIIQKQPCHNSSITIIKCSVFFVLP
ncbi:hypothetical protein AGLY_002664 [Aphis glycines]|uniref:Uncharacterized protein n=1 Tax=Aphis glycines TaxID=307491 RepID=A0A6G0U1D6_APHGL|nr:hypothetical protein AGLY_002664 [Aphis glycines]